jgi:hypothetical protein
MPVPWSAKHLVYMVANRTNDQVNLVSRVSHFHKWEDKSPILIGGDSFAVSRTIPPAVEVM